MSANLENSVAAIGLEKGSFHPNPKNGQCQRMLRLPQNHAHFTCQQDNVQHQARLQQYVIRALPDIQDGFRKGREITDQIANICWIMEKTREFQ